MTHISIRLGRPVYGLGVMALGAIGVAWGDFILGQPVPRDFPYRLCLAYGAGAFMLVAGAAVEWRRTAACAAAALAAYFGLIVLALMNGRVALGHYAEYLTYESAAEQLAIAAGASIVYASDAAIDEGRAGRIARASRIAFGISAIVFGGAHFVYMKMTAPLVPQWLPPSPEFWAYATGIGHIAAGLAIITGVQARLAAILLTLMYASFTPLVHLPMLVGDPSNRMAWTENAINLVLTGVAWVVADSLRRGAGPARREAHRPEG
jgi:uncharacterized membrane protein YphA (DoxX/SURF4 family)